MHHEYLLFWVGLLSGSSGGAVFLGASRCDEKIVQVCSYGDYIENRFTIHKGVTTTSITRPNPQVG